MCTAPIKFVARLTINEFKLKKKGKQHEHKRKSKMV